MSTNEINQPADFTSLRRQHEGEQKVTREQNNKAYMKLNEFKYTLNDAKKVAYAYGIFIVKNVNVDNLITEGMTMNAISDAFLLEYAKRGQRLDYPDSEKLNTEPVTYAHPANGFIPEHFVYDKVTGCYSQIMYDS